MSIDNATRALIEAHAGLPERGAGRRYRARLPDGSVETLRLNNLGFADASRQLHVLSLRRVHEWLGATARPGDFLHLDLQPDGGADMAIDVVHGTAPAASEPETRHAVVAVRSDWTDPRGLLGYFNPLTGSYARTTVVDLLLAAADDPEQPYVVVLDEMNLARVEYYFSDFLSALESGDAIELMPPGVEDELLAAGHDDVPARLQVPANVSFVGTVNVDETTHAFSPKVLDRANVIEFSDVDVERALGHPVDSAGEGLRLAGGTLDPAWLCTSRSEAIEPKSAAHEVDGFTEALEDVHDLLERHHLHFGYRVIDEVSAFVGHALSKAEGDTEAIVRRAFDLQLLQKILPKLSGGRELEEPLAGLLAYCLDAGKPTSIDVEAVKTQGRAAVDAGTAIYPGAARKLLRMLDRLAATGFVAALG
jgi:hypothetical protein